MGTVLSVACGYSAHSGLWVQCSQWFVGTVLTVVCGYSAHSGLWVQCSQWFVGTGLSGLWVQGSQWFVGISFDKFKNIAKSEMIDLVPASLDDLLLRESNCHEKMLLMAKGRIPMKTRTTASHERTRHSRELVRVFTFQWDTNHPIIARFACV